MYKKILAIIPARGGSKGIPGKNIKPLAGKPLISYTIEAVLGSKLIDRVIVSTDDKKIAQVAKKYKAEVPFFRPAYASTDRALAINVICHALKWFKDNENYTPDIIIYLQPTSPLRTKKQINEAIKFFLADSKADTLVSVIEPPHNFHPIKLMKMKGKYLAPYLEGQGVKKLDRQKMPIVFARNGPAILITRYDVIMKQKKLYGRYILPYVMDEISSIDIDHPIDLELAEFYINKGNKI